MTKKLKLVVIGYAGHGKDTVCELLRDSYGYTFESSSVFALERAVYPKLAPLYGYKTKEECLADKNNHRPEWFEAIKAYGKDDPARLGRELLGKFDVYCGLRNKEELTAMEDEDLFDYIIWVDAEKRLGTKEDRSSMTIAKDSSVYIIDNNGTLDELRWEINACVLYLTNLANDNTINRGSSYGDE